MIVSITI